MLNCICCRSDGTNATKSGIEVNFNCSRNMKIAIALFIISAVALTVTALLTRYPTTATIFYTTFSILGFLGLVGMIVAYFRKNDEKAIPANAGATLAPSTTG